MSPVTMRRKRVVDGIAQLRQLLEEETENLLELQTPAGYVLLDVCTFLGLEETETKEALGETLYSQVQEPV